jgi:hypothetical protein
VAAEFAEHPINSEIERTLTGIRAARSARDAAEDVAGNVSTVVRL